MKKLISRTIGVIMAVVMATICAMIVPVNSEAATSTFSGTVSDKTTAEVLYLVTSGGTMEIKIDASTNLDSAKFLLPGYKVTCECYNGNDEYWHASVIKGSATAGTASVDTSKQSLVTGTLAKGTNEQMLFLKTKDGTMEIKIDPTTDVSGVRMFLMGRTLQVLVSRGSDAYMHALAITDSGVQTTATATVQTQTVTPSLASNVPTYSVTGKVDKASTYSLLYLKTKDGTMQIKIDPNADISGCHVLMPDTSVTVGFYNGNDEYLHTFYMLNNTAKQAPVTTLDPNQITVSGTVGDKTSESTLYLATSGGTMQIRLDASTNFSACPIILKGKSVQVVCQRGADEYYHAVSIAAK